MNDQLCDDGSNLISAVQSAVTHFFGQHEPRVNEEMPEQDGSSTQSQSSPTKQSQQQQQCSSTSETASITILPSSSSNSSSTYLGDSSNNNNILLTSRARSMSPSLSLHSISNTESLSYYPDMYYYYNNPLLINCNSPTNYYYGTYEQDPQDDGAWSYFETSDFSSQTWLNVLQETDTIHYCGAGAAILTAVIIIHPLALIGAAATAAVGASAAWAVGLFHDLDKGYQIWNHDDFGMLFWEEEGANVATGATNVVVDPCNFVSNTAAVGGCSSATTTTAAIATWGSQQIIQRNEEELRRAFLLEQEEKQQREKKEALLLLEQQQGQGVVEEEAKLGDNDETDDRDIVTLPQQQQQSNVETKLQSISLQETNRLIRINSAPVKELSSSSSIRVKSSRKQNQQQQVLLPPRQQQPNKATQHPTNPLHPPTILSTQQSLDRHYPPLEIRVVSEVEFMDLNTIEFFQVFFSDDAPYSMKDFQQKRGDVDIVYGTWKDVIDVQKLSSFKKQQQPGLVFPFPPNSYTRERVLTFHTMTKSYFGPAYAKATKIQRATQLSKHLLVIENMTQLSEVPFSDRFQVLERWIVEAVKSSSSNDGSSSSSGGGGGSGGGLYTCKLTVYAEVVMISSCRFEPQIRKKASETFTELTLGWCKLATKALEATKEQKRKRMRKHEQQQEQLDDRNDYSVVLVGDDEASWQDEEERSKKSRVGEVLLAKHQQKFQELDDLVSHGDGIEVMHSIKAGAHSAFAQVLETPPSSLSHSSSSGLLKLRDGTVVEVARRRTTNANNNSSTITPFGRIPRKMNRSFLLRKLSSRVRSRQQSR